MNIKAQGALEYLLMIGAAILVVAVVIIALSGVLVETKDQNTSQDYNNQLQDLRGLIGGSGNKSGGGSSFSCDGSIPNAILCDGDNIELSEDTLSSLVSSCTSNKKCEYVCIDNYHLDNGMCVLDTITYSCTGSTPLNSIICSGDNEGLTSNTNNNNILVEVCGDEKCEYVCDEGFILINGQCVEKIVNVSCTNGTITPIIFENENYYLCTYKSNGTFTIDSDLDVELLIVAGGGAGGTDAGGGGGAGGLIHIPSYLISSGSYSVVVGDGGIGGPQYDIPESGKNSSFAGLTAIGGGAGAYYCGQAATSGGSGGGAAPWFCSAAGGSQLQTLQSGDSGTYGYGNDGSSNGGGGGAGGMGEADSKGGIGLEFPQFASVGGSPAGWFAGGGSGSGSASTVNGGGGRGSNWTSTLDPSANGVANTGGGGGGGAGGAEGAYGGYGGSGIVIIKYPA